MNNVLVSYLVEYSVQFKIICLAIFTIKSLQSSYLYIVET